MILFFGCWNRAGHFLAGPGNLSVYRTPGARAEHYGPEKVHIDGTLAPRHGPDRQIVWAGMGATRDQRLRIARYTEELPQGLFLHHQLDNDFSAIQWWDRVQGDERGACNSTILLEGKHTAEEVLAAGRFSFPHVFDNLARAGIELFEVKPGPVPPVPT